MALYPLTIFLSAFLLFQVQPLIAKHILPWYGGGPGVWTACMWFFQIVHTEHYERLSRSNRIRSFRVSPLRGVIRDRQGRVLAKNQPSFTVALESRRPARWEETRAGLASVLAFDGTEYPDPGVADSDPVYAALV